MGSHASDENIYLLGRDEAETERYVFLDVFTLRIKSRDTHEGGKYTTTHLWP